MVDAPSNEAASTPGASQAAAASSIPAASVAVSNPADPMLDPVPLAARVLSNWSESVQLLKARSLDLRVSLLDVTRAEAQSRVALAAMLPSVNAGANYTHQLLRRTTQTTAFDPATNTPITRESTSPTADTLSGSVALTQPLFNAPAYYAIGTAHVAEEVARYSVEELKRQLTLGLANAIVAVVAAERVAELNRNGLANALTRRALTAAKLRNGAATSLDLQRADQDVIAVRATLITGDESLRQAREALGLALGLSEPVGVRPDFRIESLGSDASSACQPVNHFEERPDFAVLAKQREVADRQVKSVELQYLPTLNLQSAISSSTPRAAIAPPVLWNIQAVLGWSIWDGGARYGAKRGAQAAADQVGARREALQRVTTIEVEQARRKVSVTTSAVMVATQARDAAAQIDAMTQKTFRAGMSTSLELVVAASALRQAEISLALRQFEAVQAKVAASLILSSCPW
jgi:outer membrane protein TolC